MSRPNARITLAATASIALSLGTGLAACSAPEPDSKAVDTSTVKASDCTPEKLNTVTKGKLTVATDQPAYGPWVIDNKPESGKGYESAVAYAVGKKLGFSPENITWQRVPFNVAVAGSKNTFDFDLNQISITDARRKAVDFSSGYYDVRQTVITYKGSKIAQAKSIADLKDAKLGAQVGTTSYLAVTEQIKASQTPAVFDTNDQGIQALKNKQIDGLVVDLPTAFYMIGAQMDGNGVIIGQLPQSGKPEQFGLVLKKDSSLTKCVSWSVDQLREDGTLAKLEKEWLAGGGAPELKQ